MKSEQEFIKLCKEVIQEIISSFDKRNINTKDAYLILQYILIGYTKELELDEKDILGFFKEFLSEFK